MRITVKGVQLKARGAFIPRFVDAPTSIHEMLSEMDERKLKFLQDYKLNLLTSAQIAEENFVTFRTGLGAVMQFARHRNDQDTKWMERNN